MRVDANINFFILTLFHGYLLRLLKGEIMNQRVAIIGAGFENTAYKELI